MLGRICGEAGSLHEARLAPDVGFRAGKARIEWEVDDGGSDDDVGHRIAERRDDAHGEHEEREGHDRIGDAPDDAVRPAAKIAGRDAGDAAEREDERDGGDGNGHVEARGDEHAAEDVAAELVGAEEMPQARLLQRGHRVAGEGIVRGDPGAEDGDQHQRDEEREGNAGDGIV